jgi:hypothetical protein
MSNPAEKNWIGGDFYFSQPREMAQTSLGGKIMESLKHFSALSEQQTNHFLFFIFDILFWAGQSSGTEGHS